MRLRSSSSMPRSGDNASEPINTTYFHDGPASGKPPRAETTAPFQLSIVFEDTFDSDQRDTHPHPVSTAKHPEDPGQSAPYSATLAPVTERARPHIGPDYLVAGRYRLQSKRCKHT